MKNADGWKQTRSEVFWGEVAPCDHVLQIYENDDIFLDALAGYVGAGINAGDCCIVIGTASHLKALEQRLHEHVVSVDTLIADGRYVPLDADETLAKFMVNGMPDEKKFMQTFKGLLKLFRRTNRNVRAFGEMVALLWKKGFHKATLRLEQLWDILCKEEKFSLFCAYPENVFKNKKEIEAAIHVCGTHSKMIAGSEKQLREVFYRNIGEKGKGKNELEYKLKIRD